MRGPESRHTQTPGLRWISFILRIGFFATNVAMMVFACKLLDPVPLYTKDTHQLVETRTGWYSFLTGILAAMTAMTADIFEVVGLFFYVMKIFPGNALIMDLAAIGSCIASFVLLQPPHSTNDYDVFTTDYDAPDLVKKSTLIGLSGAILAERVIAIVLSFVWYKKNGTEKQEHVSHLESAVSEYDKPTYRH